MSEAANVTAQEDVDPELPAQDPRTIKGAIVSLTCGGPPMTVRMVRESDTHQLSLDCVWVHEGDLKSARLPIECFRVAAGF